MDSDELAWGAFRTALISPLLTGEIPCGPREAYMQSVASEERLFPNGKRAKVSVRTLWRWFQRMRSDLVINKILRAELGAELPSSTLRLFGWR